MVSGTVKPKDRRALGSDTNSVQTFYCLASDTDRSPGSVAKPEGGQTGSDGDGHSHELFHLSMTNLTSLMTPTNKAKQKSMGRTPRIMGVKSGTVSPLLTGDPAEREADHDSQPKQDFRRDLVH